MRKSKKKPMRECTADNLVEQYDCIERCRDARGNLLHSDQGHPKVYCTICKQQNKKGEFADGGASLLDRSTITTHLKSATHRCAAGTHKAAAEMKRVANKAVGKFVTSAFGWVPKLLLIVTFFAVYTLPASLFCHMLDLLRFLGVSITQHKYSNARYYWAFLQAVGEFILAAQLLAMHQSPFWGLMADTSSDVAGHDNLLLYVTYCDPQTFQRFVQYLCAVRVSKKTAEALLALLVQTFAVLGLRTEGLISWASDGDSAFMGKRTGLVVRLQALYCKWLVALWCCAHRTALMMGDAEKAHPWLEADVDAVLKLVHGFFAYSPKRVWLWEAFAVPLGVTALKFPLYNKTRWFSRAKCVFVLVGNLPMLLLFLYKYAHMDGQGAGELQAKLANVDTIVTFMCMRDALKALDVLSKRLQGEQVKPYEVAEFVRECMRSLVKAFGTPETPHMAPTAQAFIKQLHRMPDGALVWKVQVKGKVHSIPLQGDWNEGIIAVRMANFVAALKDYVNTRFHDAALLESFKVFDPATYKGFSKDEAAKFGKEHLRSLYNAYITVHASDNVFVRYQSWYDSMAGPGGEQSNGCVHLPKVVLSWEELCAQFKSMKRALYGMQGKTLEQAWVHLYKSSDMKASFPHMFVLVYAMMSVACHTASVERGFSEHGVVVNKKTNRLKAINADTILRVKNNGPGRAALFTFDWDGVTKLYLESTGHLGSRVNTRESVVQKLHEALQEVQLPKWDVGDDDPIIDLSWDAGDEAGLIDEEEYVDVLHRFDGLPDCQFEMVELAQGVEIVHDMPAAQSLGSSSEGWSSDSE